jgi:hypothetical protein
LSNPNVAQPTFTVSSSQSAFGIFRLTVSDGTLTHTDDVVINVTAPPRTPATEFSAERENIEQIITTNASHSLTSVICV